MHTNIGINFLFLGTAVAQWLRCCVTNRKVAGSGDRGSTVVKGAVQQIRRSLVRSQLVSVDFLLT